jgi:large subunit ribosomal protein L6
MSRTIKTPLNLPDGVIFQIDAREIRIHGPRGEIVQPAHYLVQCHLEGRDVWFNPKKDRDKRCIAMTGTLKALCRNHIHGVKEGYTKRLQLVGVGYRAEMQGDILSINLGYSHPIRYKLLPGISVQTPQPTEIVVSGVDKYLVGQVAAEIRNYRKPEPYKGKGIRYYDENILIKETKKK